ncbi:VOC family protein [Chroococcidiopsis thermalis]|uniref:Glyoxalase/bleomycin resistance protein/dioxygenase n=1 Tax=Chroococcidiopsis thermalis (strain PCC 7203) TaxID=251229 RepID=K9UAA9_CHRTP|nr:VOC family protein [Chroococcidiopsis thermalis]AFY91174.1 Glyoxalase/bleomycin resistance protein/dioxygenase [Chroococcidiopsis thermalis PCC 7203]
MLKRIDHIYLSVSDFSRSEAFYDSIMQELGQHKGDKFIAGEPHAHYFGPQFQLTIRPAKLAQKHDPYAPGLHHLCFQVETVTDVDLCFEKLRSIGIEVTQPQRYPEYHPQYYAIFFEDPDGIRLEIVAKTSARQALESQWDELREFLNPLQASIENERHNA